MIPAVSQSCKTFLPEAALKSPSYVLKFWMMQGVEALIELLNEDYVYSRFFSTVKEVW